MTVLKIMLDTKVSAGTRLRAAEIVLEQAAGPGKSRTSKIAWRNWSAWRGSPEQSRQRSDLTFVKSLPDPDTTRRGSQRPPADTAENPTRSRRVTPWQNLITQAQTK